MKPDCFRTVAESKRNLRTAPDDSSSSEHRLPLHCLSGEPRSAIFADKGYGLLDRIHAMRNRKVDFARKLAPFLQHTAPRPINQFRPHLSHKDKWRVVKL